MMGIQVIIMGVQVIMMGVQVTHTMRICIGQEEQWCSWLYRQRGTRVCSMEGNSLPRAVTSVIGKVFARF